MRWLLPVLALLSFVGIWVFASYQDVHGYRFFDLVRWPTHLGEATAVSVQAPAPQRGWREERHVFFIFDPSILGNTQKPEMLDVLAGVQEMFSTDYFPHEPRSVLHTLIIGSKGTVRRARRFEFVFDRSRTAVQDYESQLLKAKKVVAEEWAAAWQAAHSDKKLNSCVVTTLYDTQAAVSAICRAEHNRCRLLIVSDMLEACWHDDIKVNLEEDMATGFRMIHDLAQFVDLSEADEIAIWQQPSNKLGGIKERVKFNEGWKEFFDLAGAQKNAYHASFLRPQLRGGPLPSVAAGPLEGQADAPADSASVE